MLYQLSYEATHWERGQFIEFISPMRSEMMWSIYEIIHIWTVVVDESENESSQCDDHFSLSSTTAVQIWIISYIPPITILSSVLWTHLLLETRVGTACVSELKEAKCHLWCPKEHKKMWLDKESLKIWTHGNYHAYFVFFGFWDTKRDTFSPCTPKHMLRR